MRMFSSVTGLGVVLDFDGDACFSTRLELAAVRGDEPVGAFGAIFESKETGQTIILVGLKPI